MKIVVTGWLGYIGSSLVPFLEKAYPEAEFVLIDKEESFDKMKISNGDFIQDDILKLNLPYFFKNAAVVIHLAGLTDPAESFKNPEAFFETNTLGTIRVAEACLQTKSSLFFPSTTSVYGKTNFAKESCGTEDLDAASPYAKSKLDAENYLRKASAVGLPCVIARFGTIFGISPHMQFRTAMNRFCRQAVCEGTIRVWHSAWEQIRPYLDLQDAIRFIHFAMMKNLFHGETYNVASLDRTVREVYGCLKNVMPGLEVDFIESPAMNSFSYKTDVTLSQKAGFVYEGNLQAKINEMVNDLQRTEVVKKTL